MKDKPTLNDVTVETLSAIKPPGLRYLGAMGMLLLVAGWGLAMWLYQVKVGMGASGLNHPVGWGVYIANYVFWIAIAMSGTMISGMLYLVRARFRDAISRGAEAMTVFAIIMAGICPLIHLGRLWVFYYIIPYPSQRQLWPNYISPLVWDAAAIGTYLAVSIIFFFVGLLPDMASSRDWGAQLSDAGKPRRRLYKLLAFGWCGSGSQWRHYGRAYLFFAALATPLAVSIHSVTSWDFSMGILPGWHTTIYAPYFVAGAVFSGGAMALTLLIAMRKILHLENLITPGHLDKLAKIVAFCSLLLAYCYVIMPFTDWYSGDIYNRQWTHWQDTGWIAIVHWLLVLLNIVIPLSLLFSRVRKNLAVVFVITILINMGMWLERVELTIASTAHDFMPHNWGQYFPSLVELSITAMLFCLFFAGVLAFAKLLPPVATADVKEHIKPEQGGAAAGKPAAKPGRYSAGVLGVFSSPDALHYSLDLARRSGFDTVETFSPYRLKECEKLLGHGPSPVRIWTLVGTLFGLLAAFGLTIGTAMSNNLVVGGKGAFAIIPYCVLGFETAVLLGALGNLIGLFVHARLVRLTPPRMYDPRFSRDKFGLFVACEGRQVNEARRVLQLAVAEEIHVVD